MKVILARLTTNRVMGAVTGAITAMPAGRVMKPWLARTMTTPVVAELDCSRAVNSAPARMPTAGDSIWTIQSRNG